MTHRYPLRGILSQCFRLNFVGPRDGVDIDMALLAHRSESQ